MNYMHRSPNKAEASIYGISVSSFLNKVVKKINPTINCYKLVYVVNLVKSTNEHMLRIHG